MTSGRRDFDGLRGLHHSSSAAETLGGRSLAATFFQRPTHVRFRRDGGDETEEEAWGMKREKKKRRERERERVGHVGQPCGERERAQLSD